MNADDLKKTMRMWISGVTVVTAADGIRRNGVTASSFTSIAVEPPLILISLQHFNETYQILAETGHFAVSILRNDQAQLSAQFAGYAQLPDGADRFHGVEVMTAESGAPILTESVAWLDCKVSAIHEAGPSRIVVGEVIATGQNLAATPLAYHNRGYFNIVPQKQEA
jgi:flavin reductase (DIM6/NTAB) family NADH-FMN oxidoreductase RutF